MKAQFRQWPIWSSQFAARTQREKVILLLAALAVTFFTIDALWLTPSMNDYKRERKALQEKGSESAQLAAQITQMSEQMRAQEQQMRTAFDAATRDMGVVTGQLAEFEKTLVPANRMTEFLRGLLPGSSLEVVSMKTLPPAPLIVRPQAAGDGKTALSAAPATRADGQGAPPAANLYKHGVEITLAGSYPALLEYLTRLENSPQKVLWGRLDLRSEKYPRSELTLIIYTLSLDSSWLIV